MGKSTMMRVLAVVALCIAVTAVAYDEADDMISPLSEALEVGEASFSGKGGEKTAAKASEAAEKGKEAVAANKATEKEAEKKEAAAKEKLEQDKEKKDEAKEKAKETEK